MTNAEIIKGLRLAEDDRTTIMGIFDEILEFKYENEVDFTATVTICEKAEIERGYYDYEPVTTYHVDDTFDYYANKRVVIVGIDEYDDEIDVAVCIDNDTMY